MPKRWTLDNGFEFETEELRKIYLEVDPGNCAVTDAMRNYNPPEDLMQYGTSQPQRLIFYPKDGKFREEELAVLKDFKEHCLSKGVPVPEIDNEILRALYKNQMDVAKAYDSIMRDQELISEMMPIKFTQRAHEMC